MPGGRPSASWRCSSRPAHAGAGRAVAKPWHEALASDIGFDPDGVVVAGIDPAAHGYDAARARVLQAALLDRVRSAPGVEAAAFAVWAPMGGNDWQASIRREELAGDPADATVTTSMSCSSRCRISNRPHTQSMASSSSRCSTCARTS